MTLEDDEKKKLEDLHDFFLKPTVPGSDITRAKQIDDLLKGVNSGKTMGRVILWLAGIIVAVGTAYQTMRGGLGD